MQAYNKSFLFLCIFMFFNGMSATGAFPEGMGSLTEFENDAHQIFNVLSLLSVVVAFWWLIIPQKPYRDI